MEEKSRFFYHYSAKKNNELQEIRKKYLPLEETKLDELKRLDFTATRPANVFAYIFGSISAIVMGGGMSLIMTDLADKIGLQNAMPIGIAIGLIGMIMAIVNYPLYKGILGLRRKKYAEKIIALSDKIMKG